MKSKDKTPLLEELAAKKLKSIEERKTHTGLFLLNGSEKLLTIRSSAKSVDIVMENVKRLERIKIRWDILTHTRHLPDIIWRLIILRISYWIGGRS